MFVLSSDEEEEIIEYDEESPLGTRVDPCDQSANGMSEPDSPSVEESLSDREGVASMMMSQGHLHHGGGGRYDQFTKAKQDARSLFSYSIFSS